jgi:hypothetical protein
MVRVWLPPLSDPRDGGGASLGLHPHFFETRVRSYEDLQEPLSIFER